MELSLEQQGILQKMLGKATVKFERNGAYFASARIAEMDELVAMGVLRVDESIESWGPCVTYVVNDGARQAMARLALRA